MPSSSKHLGSFPQQQGLWTFSDTGSPGHRNLTPSPTLSAKEHQSDSSVFMGFGKLQRKPHVDSFAFLSCLTEPAPAELE